MTERQDHLESTTPLEESSPVEAVELVPEEDGDSVSEVATAPPPETPEQKPDEVSMPIEFNALNEPRTGPNRDKKKYKKSGRLKGKYFDKELAHLQEELVKLQYWVKHKGLRVVVLFEGRDAAGKGGVIKRITERTSHRVVRVVALDKPTEREQTQWYFQRYVAHLPAAGEIVLFDRSWYNRALVERVMGFCPEEEYWNFMRSCPQFERMLIRDGIHLIKYWFSVSDEEQEYRFQNRANDPKRRWKLSPMDLEARRRWVDYSKAKDRMFEYTDTKMSPWFVVNSDDKKRARLNCISHLLNQIDYTDIMPDPIELPPRQENLGYVRIPYEEQTFVPEIY
jgi:polyphosphate kinase 2